MKRTLLGFSLAGAFVAAPAVAHETATPIKHVVVIFQENVSFDHYFATYPHAVNESGVPRFVARRDTPSVNGLDAALVTNNPNAAPPFRLTRAQAVTCDQDHDYTAEQAAFDFGLMDKFVEFAGNGDTGCDAKQVMGYYDGNTVTAIWNYAQHFSMSDNSFGTTFGPSTPGALNLVAGQTHGADPTQPTPKVVAQTIVGDLDPAGDDCSAPNRALVTMSGKNVGDLLNERGVTWGWFEGGFRPTSWTRDGKAVCGATHTGLAGKSSDYIPHHQPFQYYASTANPHHLPPSSTAMIGRDDRAHHQYDLVDFWDAVDAGRLPAVSFLKAPAYQDGHAGYSNPLDEQTFLVETINRLEQTRQWDETAVIVSYDDSDGWYDHVMGPIVMASSTNADALTGPGACGVAADKSAAGGRCGYGPRLPLVVVSPFARVDFVDHSITDQSSILRFIEDNWRLGRIGGGSFDALAGSLSRMFDFDREHRAPRLFLDPSTGQPQE